MLQEKLEGRTVVEREDVEGRVSRHVALVSGRTVDARCLVLVWGRALLHAVGVPLEYGVIDPVAKLFLDALCKRHHQRLLLHRIARLPEALRLPPAVLGAPATLVAEVPLNLGPGYHERVARHLLLVPLELARMGKRTTPREVRDIHFSREVLRGIGALIADVLESRESGGGGRTGGGNRSPPNNLRSLGVLKSLAECLVGVATALKLVRPCRLQTGRRHHLLVRVADDCVYRVPLSGGLTACGT